MKRLSRLSSQEVALASTPVCVGGPAVADTAQVSVVRDDTGAVREIRVRCRCGELITVACQYNTVEVAAGPN